jgi:hypothetical protein
MSASAHWIGLEEAACTGNRRALEWYLRADYGWCAQLFLPLPSALVGAGARRLRRDFRDRLGAILFAAGTLLVKYAPLSLLVRPGHARG